MDKPLESAHKSFDLSDAADKERISSGSFRVALTSIGVLLFALDAYNVALGGPHRGGVDWVAIGILWVVAGVLVAVPWLGSNFRERPIRRAIEIDAEGVKIGFTRGDPRVIKWADPGLGLTLADWTHEALAPVNGTSNQAVSLTFDEKSPLVWFSAQVLTDLLEAAKAHGVPMLERSEIVPGRRRDYTVRIIRLGDPHLTPGWSTARLPSVAVTL